jgi:hypothetical protein
MTINTPREPSEAIVVALIYDDGEHEPHEASKEAVCLTPADAHSFVAERFPEAQRVGDDELAPYNIVVNGEKLNMTAVLWRVPLFAPTKDRETASPASEDVVAMANHIALSVHGVAGDAEYWRIRNIAEREIAALASPTPRDTLVEVLTDDCEFLLSVIDSCDEAEAPSCEMEPEDVARIATIRAAINASTVDFVRSRAALNSTQQPTRDHKKAPQGRCGKCLERLRNCTCFPQPAHETRQGSYFQAMTEATAELTRLREQIAAKDAAITRFVNVHGVLTKEDREYLRAARGR